MDFGNQRPGQKGVDLVLVMGTSLQVAPFCAFFCAVPNMAPRHCTRVLVNRSIQDVLPEPIAFQTNPSSVSIGSRKRVTLRSLWTDPKASRKWRQLLIQEECDTFARRYNEVQRMDV